MTLHVLESTTSERIAIDVVTTSDPTAVPPDIAVTTGTTEPTTWVAGSWFDAWNATTGKVTALTPLVGDGETIDLNADVDYDLWIRWTADTETPVKQAGRIRVT